MQGHQNSYFLMIDRSIRSGILINRVADKMLTNFLSFHCRLHIGKNFLATKDSVWGHSSIISSRFIRQWAPAIHLSQEKMTEWAQKRVDSYGVMTIVYVRLSDLTPARKEWGKNGPR
jgi:hypothetical protein